MLAQQTERLLATLRDEKSGERAIQRAADAWVKTLQNPDSIGEILDAQEQLASVVSWDNLARAQFALMMSGALVENGFAPEPLLEAFAPLLPDWLAGANRLLARVEAAQSEAEIEQISAQMPAEARDWERLQNFYLPLMATLAASPAGRAQLHYLLPIVAPLAERNEGAYFLEIMLQVLDKAPLLVLEPARQRGFVGTMSGIDENAQLHALLMAHYPDAGAPLSKEVVAVFRGSGPQTLDQSVTGIWNLNDYHALGQSEISGDAREESAHWIWNEDVPATIPQYKGLRVVILQPATYERSWPTQRLFASLKASVDVDRELDESEVRQWMRRLSEVE